MNVVVPSISNPQQAGRFSVGEDVDLVPLNALTTIGGARPMYVVIGAGKTGMDAVLYLLNSSVEPERIQWIMPRDSWLLIREAMRSDFYDSVDIVAVSEASNAAKTALGYFEAQEWGGLFRRVDPGVQPQQFKCATVSVTELAQLRRIKQIVRMGRVKCLHRDRVELEKGTLETCDGTLYVDCSTDGLEKRPSTAVFGEERISLQSVSLCQQVFSAALIGYLEGRGGSNASKNALTTPVPHPDIPEDGVTSLHQSEVNDRLWLKDSHLASWLKRCRLHGLNQPEKWITGWQKMKVVLKNIHQPAKVFDAAGRRFQALERLSKL
eukprot:TRINITY_DN20334_c0_g1_i3.p1 TRINITY_DN20334_c0_g1~~TRINITY_DN20334_c0_g1_i3.p1  ORF type:complete len:323 (+),score=66.49 TRINITY_DN20334_c0_g1_i3:232-1200(+)